MVRTLAAISLALVLSGTGALGVESGDVEAGAKLFKQCKSCHQVGAEAKNRVGPHLNEVFGRKAGGLDGFRYSKDMQRAGADGLTWTVEKLHAFLENPKSMVTRTRMSYRGMKDAGDRANLLAFLRQYSANPQDIPESEPTATATDPDVDPAILAIAGDIDYGEYLASECTTCHQADGADRGIPSITGWPIESFVIVMHAYKSKARPHPVMQMMAGRLSDEEIASLAVYFENAEP